MSFQWSKPLPAALGGIARIDRDDLVEQVARFHHDTPVVDTMTETKLEGLRWVHRTLYRPRLADFARNTYRALGSLGLVPGSSSAAELQAPVRPSDYMMRPSARRERHLRSLLDRTKTMVNGRRAREREWLERLADAKIEWLAPWSEATGLGPRCRSAPLRVSLVSDARDELLDAARDAGVELGDWFRSPLHPIVDNLEAFGYTPGSCPRAERLCKRMLNLMTHDRVGSSDMDRTIHFLRNHALRAAESSV